MSTFNCTKFGLKYTVKLYFFFSHEVLLKVAQINLFC